MSREEWSDVTPVAFPASDSYLYVNQDAISRCISWGPGLADGITQGVARGDEFRTAPLWGIGQRMFFLHHGRRSDLLDAIKDHASGRGMCASPPSISSNACASEANSVISRFNALSKSEHQDLLNFLRSL